MVLSGLKPEMKPRRPSIARIEIGSLLTVQYDVISGSTHTNKDEAIMRLIYFEYLGMDLS